MGGVAVQINAVSIALGGFCARREATFALSLDAGFPQHTTSITATTVVVVSVGIDARSAADDGCIRGTAQTTAPMST